MSLWLLLQEETMGRMSSSPSMVWVQPWVAQALVSINIPSPHAHNQKDLEASQMLGRDMCL